MRHKHLLAIAPLIMLVTACIPSPVGVNGTATQDSANQSATQTAAVPTNPPATFTPTPAPLPSPSEQVPLTPTQATTSGAQFIAYVREGQQVVQRQSSSVPLRSYWISIRR